MDMQRVCNDPYRILFPIAFLNLILGLGVWLPNVLFGGGYPLLEHMQLMMHATMGCFVFGFLLTIFPKLWNVSPVPFVMLLLIALCFAIQSLALFFDARIVMIAAYALAHLLVLVFMCVHATAIVRALNPFIIIVYIGFLVSTLCALHPFVSHFVELPTWCAAYVNNLNMQGVMLLITAAVVPIILARIRGAGTRCGAGSQGLGLKIVVPPILSCLFIASYYPFALDSLLLPIPVAVYRALFLFLIFSHGMKLWRFPHGEPCFAWGIYFSLWSMIAGVLLPALCPVGMRIILEHLIYISGFVLLILVVSARIACGHAGAKAFVDSDKRGMIFIIACMFIAVLSRIGGYWSTTDGSYKRHLLYAVAFVLLALGMWIVRYGKYIVRFPPQSS